jgi:hypothetical protein
VAADGSQLSVLEYSCSIATPVNGFFLFSVDNISTAQIVVGCVSLLLLLLLLHR